jgi:hypothetical protein
MIEKFKNLKDEILSGKYGTKNRATLLLRITELEQRQTELEELAKEVIGKRNIPNKKETSLGFMAWSGGYNEKRQEIINILQKRGIKI